MPLTPTALRRSASLHRILHMECFAHQLRRRLAAVDTKLEYLQRFLRAAAQAQRNVQASRSEELTECITCQRCFTCDWGERELCRRCTAYLCNTPDTLAPHSNCGGCVTVPVEAGVAPAEKEVASVVSPSAVLEVPARSVACHALAYPSQRAPMRAAARGLLPRWVLAHVCRLPMSSRRHWPIAIALRLWWTVVGTMLVSVAFRTRAFCRLSSQVELVMRRMSTMQEISLFLCVARFTAVGGR